MEFIAPKPIYFLWFPQPWESVLTTNEMHLCQSIGSLSFSAFLSHSTMDWFDTICFSGETVDVVRMVEGGNKHQVLWINKINVENKYWMVLKGWINQQISRKTITNNIYFKNYLFSIKYI